MSALTQSYNAFLKAGIMDTINYDVFNAFLLTHHSTRIEGSTLTELDTRLLLEKGITPKGKPLEHANMVKDHYDALQYVLDSATTQTEISEKFIREIGSRVNRTTGRVTNTSLGTFDDSKGDYRLANAFAGSDYFLSFGKIPEHMKRLCSDLNDRVMKVSGIEEVYTLAFDAHYYLVEIHPFGDGNGRSARLLMNFVQAYHKFPLTPVFETDKKDYILALKASRTDGNSLPVREFMINQAVKYFNSHLDSQKGISENISFVF
jgi:Fic family protein